MDGYELAAEIFDNIGKESNHEMSIPDLIRVISFYGFNEEAPKTGKIGFVCSCARDKLKKIFEKALIWDDYSLYDDFISQVQQYKRDHLNVKGSLSKLDLLELTHRFGDDFGGKCYSYTSNKSHAVSKINALGNWPAFVILDMLYGTDYRWDKSIPAGMSYFDYANVRNYLLS